MRKTYDIMTEAEREELYRSFIQARKRGLISRSQSKEGCTRIKVKSAPPKALRWGVDSILWHDDKLTWG